MSEPSADLVFLNGPLVGQIASLAFGTTRAGRDPQADLSVPDNLASRTHCAFELTADGLSCSDLQSRNGVLVNNERVTAGALFNGDVVVLGETSLLVRCPWEREGEAQRRDVEDADARSSHVTRRIPRYDVGTSGRSASDIEEEFRCSMQILSMMDLGRALSAEVEAAVVRDLVEAKLRPVFSAGRCVHLLVSSDEGGPRVIEPTNPPEVPPSVLAEALESDSVQTWSDRKIAGLLVAFPYHAREGKFLLCVTRPRDLGAYTSLERGIANAVAVSLGLVGAAGIDPLGSTVSHKPSS